MKFLTQLLEHQIKAVEKLRHVKVGALYMEQGTGKTRTALELIDLRVKTKKVNHVLWLCPCSVKVNLKEDIIKHVGELPAHFTICGIETLSSSIRWNFFLLKIVQEYNCYLIVDESNLVKNHRANRTENITRLAEHCRYKLILNGTPITKNEKDLFSQWYILDWRILGYKSFWSFSANHLEYDERIRRKIKRCLNVDYLAEKIAPYVYQVKKSECLDLPSKTYETEYYCMTDEQYELYDYVANNLMLNINEWEPWTIYKLFTGLQDVISGLDVDLSSPKLKTKPYFQNPFDNPRIECLLRILSRINNDEKIIIFCKYTHEINDILKVLSSEFGTEAAVKFNGEISQSSRQKNIGKFKTSARFFVANKTCAGYGLNLQYCSYAIYYSNDWDYGTREHSEDRIHRIGQNKNVHIIDICAEYSLDKRILNCLWRKEDLIDSFKNEIEKVKDKTELIQFIKVGRYHKKAKVFDFSNLKDDE